MNAGEKPKPEDEESTSERLHEREVTEERSAREAATEATSPEEARADLRRADKARYLREKLEQQARSDRDAERRDDDDG